MDKFTAEPVTIPPGHPTIAAWLLRLPTHHPLWEYYLLSVISLTDHPGYPPANKQFPNATHEFLVIALPPGIDYEPDQPDAFVHLEPINYVYQVNTDDERAKVAGKAVVNGLLDGFLVAEPQGIMGMRTRFEIVIDWAIKGSDNDNSGFSRRFA